MKWLKVILLISLVNIGYGQRIITEDRLTLDRIFDSRDFVPDWLPPYKWLAGGSYFTTIEYNEKGNSELISYRSETGEKNTLISDQLLRTSSGQPIVIEDYYWSADEKKILIFTNSERVWRTNTRGDYYVLNLESKQIYQLGEGLPLSSLMFAKFNPQGTMVAYVSQHNLYQENLETREIQQLTTDGSEGIINGTFDWAYEEEFFCKDGFRWSPDGNSIAYWQIDANETKNFYLINNTSSIYSQVIPIQYPKVGQKPSSAKIGILDIPSKTTQWIDLPGEPYEHYLPRMQWLTPTNTLLITQLSRKQNHLTLWTVDRTSMTPDKVYEEESDTWIDIVNIDVSAAWEVEDQVSLDQGNSFLWMSDKDGWRHLYRINVKDKQVELLSTGAFDIASVKGINTKENLIYVIASPDNSTQRYLYAINTTNKSYERITPTNYSGLNNYDISPNGNFAVFEHDQSNDPGQTFFISLPDHLLKDTLITNDHFRKSLDAIKLPEVEFFKITTEDGVEMDGKMIKPLNFSKSKKYPVLFYVYGEPAAQTAVDKMDELWHIFLAQQGYVVITLDNRGTPCLKGSDWRKSIYRKVGMINARDQAMAAKQILKWPFVDPDRIAVWGWSGGGAMTLNLLFKYPEIYKTGIAVAAVTNQLLYDNIYQERYMGLPQENLEDFIEGSPASHAAGLEGNLLYIHGTGDDNVHYQNAEVLINALIENNKQFELMIYPNRTHGIYEGRNTRKHLYTTMTNYLFTHMPVD